MVETVINQNDGFVSITAVGGETELDGDFPIYEKSHVTIKRTRSGTTTTLVLNTDYTIADNQLEVTAGFTAVLAGSATPAVAGDVYTLLLDVPEARTTDFTQAGDFFAATLNRELDLYAQMSQQLRRDVGKAASLADTSTITSVTLPEPEDGKFIGWDGNDGDMANFDVDDLGGVAISSFGATLIDDTTAANARTTLGAAASGSNSDITDLTGLTLPMIRVIRRQTFAASSTYTPDANMVYADIEVWGGGGGGGGVGTTTNAAGGGGGAGGYARKVVSSATVGASQIVTIGAAGSAGANTGGNGGNGGTTSVGSLVVATGGNGGNGQNATSPITPGTGGSGSTGDILGTGEPGQMGWGGTTGWSGSGGSTSIASGGASVVVGNNVNGNNGGTGGGGGSGGFNSASTGRTGGAGGAGYAIVTEYCSQ